MEYWHKQDKTNPLFADLIWSRPEHAKLAGKLNIVGGNVHSFSRPALAYSESLQAGIGAAKVLLPDVLSKTVNKVFPGSEYAPSTPSGSFSRLALSNALTLCEWADATLLAGDFGRNSETAIMLEQLVLKYAGVLGITSDALDYFTKSPSLILSRDKTLLVLSFAQLQKIAMNSKFVNAFTFDMDFLRLITLLHEFTSINKVILVLKHLDTYFVAYEGKVSTTKVDQDAKAWRVKTAAHSIVWWLQNPAKPFEAISSSIVNI